MFISHDKDTASSLWIDAFKRRILFSYCIQTQDFIFILQVPVPVSYFKSFLVNVYNFTKIWESVYKNDNKGIIFTVVVFVRPNINTHVTIIFAWNDSGYALVIPIKWWSRPYL